METEHRILGIGRAVVVGLLVVVAAAALASAMHGRSTGAAASAAYYGYCPGGSSSAVYYGYCPPVNRPPDCSAVGRDKNEVIWPANHKFRLVTLTGATDPDGDTVTLTITGVTQDEPVNGVADGNTSPDAEPGPQSDSVYIRGERAANGDGRVYRISFTASDGKGGTCSGVVKVGVPRTKHATPIDSAPPSYNSFGP